jgi:MFS family permease
MPWYVMAIFMLFYAVGGMGIGVFSGILTALITKVRPWKFGIDALLGGLGYLAGLFGAFLFPWHENTITEPLEGGGVMTSTAPYYQHPHRVAIVCAILLPLFYELNRFRLARKRHVTEGTI